jgi:hypothetical protein
VVEVAGGSNPGIFNMSQGACSAADDAFQVQPTSGTTVCYTRMATPYAVGKSATANGVLVTNGSGVPSISTRTAYVMENSGYATLNAAVAGIGSTPAELVIGQNYTLTASLTIPSTMKLTILQGGGITKASTYTLTINGPFSAPVSQVFSGFGAGDVTFNPAYIDQGYAEWWGCKSDQSVDCLASLQDAAASNLPKLQLMGGDYLISATWKINRSDFVVEGQSVLFQTTGKPVTRLMVASGSANVMQIGPDTDPGSINAFINNITLSNVQFSRNAVNVPPAPGSEINAPTGLLLQYARSVYLDNLYSDSSLIGFTFNGTSNVRTNYLHAFISDASLNATPVNPNFFWGYYFNGAASIGAAGGNASDYLINSTMSNAASAARLANGSIGLGFSSLFEDVYVQQFEAAAASKCVSIEGASGAVPIGNNNLTIINPICDQSSQWGLYIHNLSNYASVTVVGGYNAPISGSPSIATAGIGIYNSGGSVHISGFQHVNQSATNIACEIVSSSTGVKLDNICTGSLNAQGAVQLISANNNAIYDVVNAPAGTSSGAAVYATGSSYNYIAPSVMGASGVYTYAVNFSGSGNSANEVNLSGVNGAAISGGIGNAMRINGSTISSNGISSSNLVSGYPFGGSYNFGTTGTVTLPDTATFASTGYANSNSYSTSGTSAWSWGPTWNFSSTSNGLAVMSLTPTMVPTGASAGNVNGVNLVNTVGTSAVNISTVRMLTSSLTVSAGYTGTITTAMGFNGGITNNGTNAIGTTVALNMAGTANGNGVTTGTVNNQVATFGAHSAAAGLGGTINNDGVKVTVGTGSGAGTTTNRGVYITGNGGSGGSGTTNNYAIYSDSTAPSSFAGIVATSALKTSTALVTAVDGGSTAAFTANMVGATGWLKAQDSSGGTIWIPVWK